MGVMTALYERRASEKTFIDNPAQWLVDMFGGRSTWTGGTVTEQTALQATGMYGGVFRLAETMGSIPRFVYRRRADGGKDRDPAHPVYRVVHLQANPEMDSMMCFEMMHAHIELRNNAYAEIVRDGAGRVQALWPWHPDRVRVDRVDGELVYSLWLPPGQRSSTGSDVVSLPRDRVLHVRALALNGVTGLPLIQTQRESIGLTLALDEFGSRFFGNNAVPSGVLEHPGTLGKDSAKRIRDSWESRHLGLSQANRVAVLEEGMKFHQMGVENEKSQFLGSRQYQVGEAARILRIPGIMIGADDKSSTYASAEQFFLAYVVHSLRPRAVRWEMALTTQLLTQQEQKTHYVEHLLDGLLRGDAQSRAQALQIQFDRGAIEIDEWRALENRNPYPDGIGKKAFVALNMIPLDQVGKEPPAPAVTAPTPAPAPDPDPADEPAPRALSPHDRLLTGLLQDTAARALRREIEGVKKIGEKNAAKAEAWRQAVDEFYARHAAYLAEMFHCSLDTARTYTADHRADLLARGLEAVTGWAQSAPAALTALGLGSGPAPALTTTPVVAPPPPTVERIKRKLIRDDQGRLTGVIEVHRREA